MANLYWDADGDSSVNTGGTGNWDTSSALWRIISSASSASTGSMGTARWNFASAVLPNGKVLVAGGGTWATNGSTRYATAELYDPSLGTWSTTGSMSISRSWCTATLLTTSGKVLIVGDTATSTVTEFYNPDTGTFSTAGVASYAIGQGHTATLLDNGKVLVTGGYSSSGIVASCQLYDPDTNTWSSAASMASIRAYHTATLLDNGKVLVTGGYNGSTYLATCELYNPETNTWSTTTSMPVSKHIHSSILLPSGKVLIVGGPTTSTAYGLVYDPDTATWSNTGTMSVARYYTSPVLISGGAWAGKVLVIGGTTGSTLTSTELYSPSSNTWSTEISTLSSRWNNNLDYAKLLNNGKIISIGGYNNTTTIATCELYTLPSNSLNTWGNTGGNIAYFSNTSGAITLAANVSIGGMVSEVADVVVNTTGSNVITLTAASVINTTTGNLTVNTPISGAFNLTKTGVGTLNLNSDSAYTGATLLTGGNLVVSSIKSLSFASPLGAPTTAANGTLALGASTAQVNLQYTGTGDTTDRVINLASLTGNVVLTQAGTGLLKFTSNLTATGAGVKNLVLDGSSQGSGEILGVIVNNSATNLTRLVKNGSGTWTLSGNNTFTGPVTVNGGNLIVTLLSAGGAAGSLGASGNSAANLVINGGYLNYSNNTVSGSLTRSYTIGTAGGGFAATGDFPLHILGDVTLAGTNTPRTINFIVNSPSYPMRFDSALGDNGTGKTSINISGVYTLLIRSNTTFTGDITINSGGLSLGSDGRLGGGNYPGNISLGGTNLSTISALDQTISGNITGLGSVNRLFNSGKLILTGNNTYSSGTLLTSGNLVIGSETALGTGILTIVGGALDILAPNISINNALSIDSDLSFWGTGNLTQSYGDIILTSSDTTFNVANRSLKLGGNISGASNLTKIGSGNLTLSSNNTFEGNVSVSGGNLVLESSAALPNVSGFTLNGGSLASYINIAKDVTLSSGSLIGNSVVNSNVTVADILANSLVADSGNLVLDTLILSGQATFTASETSKVLVSNLTNTLSNVSSRYINLNVVGSLTNGFKDAFIYGNNTVELNDFNLKSVPNLGASQVALLQQGNNSVGVFVTTY